MGLSRSRLVTLIVAFSTLTTNLLSSVLCHQLPDDPYHLASNFGWYLHFANVASVFGIIGALRQHSLSIVLFAHYLIINTILSSVARLLILTTLNELISTFCTPLPSSYSPHNQNAFSSSQQFSSAETHHYSWTSNWTPAGCANIVYLSELTLAVGVIMTMILQFVGVFHVRQYGRALWIRDCWAEAREVIGAERRRSCELEYGLPIIDEELGEMAEKM